MLSSFLQANLNSYGKLTSRRGRWSARIWDAGNLVSHTSQHDHEKKRHACMGDGLVCYRRHGMGDSRGSLAVCAQSCRAKSLGLGLRSPTNSTEVNSALSIQSSSPRFCTKTSGGLGLVQGWGAGTRGQGPRGESRDRGATEARRFPVRVLPMSGSRSSSF